MASAPPPRLKRPKTTLGVVYTAENAPLSEMQRQFVVNYVDLGMTVSAAAAAAGFAHPRSQSTALLKNPKVARAIEERRAQFAAASQMSKKKVIDGFLEAIEMAKIKADPLTMVAGWREVGKMCGFYEPVKAKLEVSVRGQVLLQRLNDLTDEDLLRISEGDSSIIEGCVTDVEPTPGTDESAGGGS